MFGYRVPAPDQAMLDWAAKAAAPLFRVVQLRMLMPFIRKVWFSSHLGHGAEPRLKPA